MIWCVVASMAIQIHCLLAFFLTKPHISSTSASNHRSTTSVGRGGTWTWRSSGQEAKHCTIKCNSHVRLTPTAARNHRASITCVALPDRQRACLLMPPPPAVVQKSMCASVRRKHRRGRSRAMSEAFGSAENCSAEHLVLYDLTKG